MTFQGLHHSEETKQKIANTHKGIPHSEERKRKISEARKGQKPTEETKRKMSISHVGNKCALGYRHTEENLKRMSDGHKGIKKTDETRRKLSDAQRGEKGHNWRGGLTKQRYCRKFNRPLKEQIRDKFGRKCFLCQKTEKQEGKKLPVHHCDYNKGQGCGQKWCLIPLCRSCHTKTNFHRYYYFNLLSNYWALKYVEGVDFGRC